MPVPPRRVVHRRGFLSSRAECARGFGHHWWAFERQILDSPKDVEITDWCSRVAAVSKAISSDFCRCLWGNRIRKQPAGLLEAVHDLIFRPDKDQIYRVSCCPGSGVGYFWIGRKIRRIRVKAEKDNKCSYKQQQHTEDTRGSDDRFSHTSSLVGRFPNVSVDRRFLDREMLPPQQLQLLFHMLAAHLGVPDRRLNDRHPTFGDMPQVIGHLFQAPVTLSRLVRKIVAQVAEIDVVDERGFCKARPRLELLPPLMDTVLRPPPPIDFSCAWV